MRHLWLWLACFCILSGVVGYWLAHTAVPRWSAATVADEPAADLPTVVVAEAEPKFRSGERKGGFRADDEALAAGALPGRRALLFKDRAAMEAFLAKLGGGVKVLARMDSIHALQVGFLDPAELAALLGDGVESGFIFPAWLPEPKVGSVQDGAVGVGANLLKLLGIKGDNSQWGKGLWVAVLDTGVSQHSGIGAKITSLNLVEMPEDLAKWNGHGTAVAGGVAGKAGLTPGVAPGVDGIFSVRIGNDDGYSDSGKMAQGIIAAADAGTPVIVLAFGSSQDSALVRRAVEYAQERGVVIVASAGNNGTERLSYPAGNNGVVGVGAVDAKGERMDFSNYGENLAIMTYGYEVNAPWTQDENVAFTGTSASAPVVAGAIAAAMNPGNGVRRSAQDAAALVYSKLNDAGAPGWDPYYGYGLLDMGRVMNADVRGIYDAAAASNYLVPAGQNSAYPELQVVVQNRGTENLVNTSVSVDTPLGVRNFTIPVLPVDQIRTFSIPLPGVDTATAGGLRFSSTVTLSDGRVDSNPANNRRVETYSQPKP